MIFTNHTYSNGQMVSMDVCRCPMGPMDIDLTAAQLFVRDNKYATDLLAVVRKHADHLSLIWEVGRTVSAPTVLSVLLNSFRGMHALWCTRTSLTQPQLQQYQNHVSNMKKSWKALNWKVTPWAHWTMIHSPYILTKYRSLYIFFQHPHRSTSPCF